MLGAQSGSNTAGREENGHSFHSRTNAANNTCPICCAEQRGFPGRVRYTVQDSYTDCCPPWRVGRKRDSGNTRRIDSHYQAARLPGSSVTGERENRRRRRLPPTLGEAAGAAEFGEPTNKPNRTKREDAKYQRLREERAQHPSTWLAQHAAICCATTAAGRTIKRSASRLNRARTARC